jgi:methionyl-tRNA formyltransferase
MSAPETLVLTKPGDWGARAIETTRTYFPDAEALTGRPDTVAQRMAESARHRGTGPRLISFIYGHVLPAPMLHHASLAINFHPGSRAYPGTGCYNFALYDGAAEYGCVCHHMAPKVDSGAIVAERTFPIRADETVESLRTRTLEQMLMLLESVLASLARDGAPPATDLAWQRRPFTRRALEALCRITPDMSADEVRRRVRATSYPGYPGAYVELHGMRFIAEGTAARSAA